MLRVRGERQTDGEALAAALDDLPMAVYLFTAAGRVDVCAGGLASFVGTYIPSCDQHRRWRWRVYDASGRCLEPTQWPGSLILRGDAKESSAYARYDGDGGPLWFKECAFATNDEGEGNVGVGLLQSAASDPASLGGVREWIEDRMMSALLAAQRSVETGAVHAGVLRPATDKASLAGAIARDSANLSPREAQVVQGIIWGKPYKEIAFELGIAVKTVAFHRRRALAKLGLDSRQDLMRFAAERGWLGNNG